MSLTKRERETRDRARSRGAEFATIIIEEAKRAGIGVPLAFALVEQESGFRNIFGHDPTIFAGAGKVTKTKYLAYKRQRGSRGQGGMQGVGLTQLTYYTFQDQADRLGGCWVPTYQLRVGFAHLELMIQRHGLAQGLGVYNGGEGRPNMTYSNEVLQKHGRWHRWLVG